MEYVYRNMRPKVIDYITNNSGRVSDADEILHISFLKLYNRVRNAKTPLKIKNFDHYFFAIVRKTWINKQKMNQKTLLYVNKFFDELELPEDGGNDKELLYKYMYDKFLLLPESCRKLLTMYYVEGCRMKEVAEKLNYTSLQSAINQKSRCFINLKMMIKNFKQNIL